jgi:heliorhodopsin
MSDTAPCRATFTVNIAIEHLPPHPSRMTDVHPLSRRALGARSAAGLRRLSGVIGCAHAVQAIALLVLAADASLPVTASFLAGPPGAGDYGSVSLGSLRIDWLVAAFLLLAAIDHLTLSAGRPRRWYEANVARGINPARWWEYSLSASLMVVLIAMLAGVTELVALVAPSLAPTPR